MLHTAIAKDTPLGREANPLMELGRLVPDELLVKLIGERTAAADCRVGFVLVVFPRTLPQASRPARMPGRDPPGHSGYHLQVTPAALLPTPNGPVPLGTIGHVVNDLEYGVIWERDRQPTITVQSDVKAGAQGIDVTHAIEKKLESLRAGLPVGYRIEVGGPVEESEKGQSSINAQMPIMAIVVLTLLMIQLQSFARVMMVVLTAPLGLIGVVIALLLFNKPFGFVAMLGVIAMFGIIMRNSVILVDQIEQDIAAGHPRFDAIVGATVRRFRPITLTAAAAVLALIPLLRSNFFGPMATALMGGITSATVLTLFYLPALYAASFKVRRNERAGFEDPNTPDAHNGGQS